MDTAEGRWRAEHILAAFPTCPIPKVARLGRTPRKWRDAFLAYSATSKSNNGGTEAGNEVIELHRRLARGCHNRESYRLRILLAASGIAP